MAPKVGDLVWAKMKGFPAWPGKVIEPKTDVTKKQSKKGQHFVFFFGSENYAWIHEDGIFPYLDFKSRFLLTTRIPKGFKEALESIEDCVKNLPKQRKSTAQSDPDYKSKAAVPKERRSSAAKRKSEKFNKAKVVEKNKKVIKDDKTDKGLSEDTWETTSNGRPARRSSRSASSTSNQQGVDDEQVDFSPSNVLEGKHVVPYEEYLALEETTGQDSVKKEEIVNDDSQASNQDIFAEYSDNTNSVFKIDGTENDSKRDTDLTESTADSSVVSKETDHQSQAHADNLFEKLGFGASLAEPSAEEMFDEMIRSSTPNASQKSSDSGAQSSQASAQESDKVISETLGTSEELEPSSDTCTQEEPISPLKLLSSDLRETKSKTPTIALSGRKLTPKRTGSPTNTPASKKSRILEKATPKATATPKHYDRPVVAASSSDSKPAAGISPDASPAVGEAPPKTIIATPAKIGFLGLGIMGQGMVTNLLKSGHEVTVWNRTASKCREFVKEGALKGNSPAEVVAQCDITFSCVSDPTALKDLVFGNCGVLQGIGSKKSYVDMSTVDVETVIDIHDAVMARGGRFLEAPVIGSKNPAQNGELVILSAGDISLYEDCYSCFQAIGKKTLYLGDIGNAARMKLVVNMLTGTVAAGLAESMALAEKIGLDQAELLRVLMLSDVASSLVEAKGTAIMNSKFETNFPLQHQQKDLRLAIDMADSVDQPMYVISAANELFKKAKAKGYGEHDMSAIYRAADM